MTEFKIEEEPVFTDTATGTEISTQYDNGWKAVTLDVESLKNNCLFPVEIRQKPAEYLSALIFAKENKKSLGATILALNTAAKTKMSAIQAITAISDVYGQQKFNSNFVKCAIIKSGLFPNFKVVFGRTKKNDETKVEVIDVDLPDEETRARCEWDGGSSNWTPTLKACKTYSKNNKIWLMQPKKQLEYKAINDFSKDNAIAYEMFGGDYTEQDAEFLEGLKSEKIITIN